jgi:hypothetical protein
MEYTRIEVRSSAGAGDDSSAKCPGEIRSTPSILSDRCRAIFSREVKLLEAASVV